MFFGAFVSKSELDIAEIEIADLKAALQRAQETIKALRQQERDAKTSDIATATFSVDFDEMDAFSIERMEKGSSVITVIGHTVEQTSWDANGNSTSTTEIKEWSLYCSHDQHEKLVVEFDEYKKNKAAK